MKKRLSFLANVFCLVLLFNSILGCSSLGVATSGAKYFNGKKETDLVKYFKYDGEPVKAAGDYDKVLRFSNLVTTVYVDKTTTKKFKNRRYSTVSSFSFYKLDDGCYVYPETIHIQDFLDGGKLYRTVNQDVSKSQGRAQGIMERGTRTHRNNNSEISSTINSFNYAVQQYRAVKKSNDSAMFERTNINEIYYIYDIQTNRFQYSDGVVSSAVEYKYSLQSVSIYEDSKSSTETHIAYIYNDRENKYTDEQGNSISETDALKNEKSYNAKGFESRRKDKGVSLVAYIKDGVVVKVESTE